MEQPVSSTQNDRYITSLQLLRAVSLIMVYLFHQMLVDESFSRFGVCVFFVLSGFLNIYHGYGQDMPVGVSGCISYGMAKINRIFPLHVIMLTLATALYTVSTWVQVLEYMPVSIVERVVRYITNLFLISGWIPHLSVLDPYLAEYNIATWFLSDCLLFYVFTPFIIKCMHKIYDRRSDWISLPWIVISVVYVFVVGFNLLMIRMLGYSRAFWYVYSCPVSRIGDYLIGAQLGFYFIRNDRESIRERRDTHNGLWISLLFISIVFSGILIRIGCALEHPTKYLVSTGFYFTIPVCGLILSIAILDNCITPYTEKLVVGRLLLWLGAISPYAYLIQVPVINAVHGIYKRITDVRISIWCIISLSVTILGSVGYDRMSHKRIIRE